MRQQDGSLTAYSCNERNFHCKRSTHGHASLWRGQPHGASLCTPRIAIALAFSRRRTSPYAAPLGSDCRQTSSSRRRERRSGIISLETRGCTSHDSARPTLRLARPSSLRPAWPIPKPHRTDASHLPMLPPALEPCTTHGHAPPSHCTRLGFDARLCRAAAALGDPALSVLADGDLGVDGEVDELHLFG